MFVGDGCKILIKLGKNLWLKNGLEKKNKKSRLISKTPKT